MHLGICATPTPSLAPGIAKRTTGVGDEPVQNNRIRVPAKPIDDYSKNTVRC
jgi:hypothetical protein